MSFETIHNLNSWWAISILCTTSDVHYRVGNKLLLLVYIRIVILLPVNARMDSSIVTISLVESPENLRSWEIKVLYTRDFILSVDVMTHADITSFLKSFLFVFTVKRLYILWTNEVRNNPQVMISRAFLYRNIYIQHEQNVKIWLNKTWPVRTSMHRLNTSFWCKW